MKPLQPISPNLYLYCYLYLIVLKCDKVLGNMYSCYTMVVYDCYLNDHPPPLPPKSPNTHIPIFPLPRILMIS
jgi:hypothetical protein